MTQTHQKTALVTGGHGFLGSHLVPLLLERGFSVRCMVRPGRNGDLFLGLPVTVVAGDLRYADGLAEAAEGVDCVFHVAGLIAAMSPRAFDEVNVGGTRRLAEAVRASAPACQRFVFVSSQAASGPSPDGTPMDEGADPRPVSHYGRSKLRGERALVAALGGAVPFTVVRPPAIYGPRDEAILPFFQAASRGFVPLLDGPGRKFNLLHVQDVAEGLVAAGLAAGSANGTYFLAEPEGMGYSYGDLADALDKVFGKRHRRVHVSDLLLDFAAMAADEIAALTGKASVFGRQKAKELKARWWRSSPARARRDFGWQAHVPLFDGMRETAEWYHGAGLLKGAPFV